MGDQIQSVVSATMSEGMATCPFPECDWEYDPAFREPDTLDAEFAAEEHYEREHAGKIQIQITLETQRLIGERTPKEIREQFLERYEEKTYADVAHIRTEILEEPTDHEQLENDD
jgi:hypothetical protein